jgi:hypothetical protein
VPFYPELARETHIEGTVTLRVSTDGKRVFAVDAQGGHPLLADAAKENVKTWTFGPHVATSFEVTFRYKLLTEECDSECHCDSSEKESVLLHLPATAEVNALSLMTCDPAVQRKRKK